MIMLILNDEQMLDLEEMNASGSPVRRLEPIQLADGRRALNSDLLMDLDPGAPFGYGLKICRDGKRFSDGRRVKAARPAVAPYQHPK